jgi:hypothetical protein
MGCRRPWERRRAAGPPVARARGETDDRLLALVLALASFAPAQAPPFQLLDNPIPAAAAAQAAGDVDGDGDQDLLIPDGIMVNDGHGRFTKVAINALAFTRLSARLADLNGDGLADPFRSSLRRARSRTGASTSTRAGSASRTRRSLYQRSAVHDYARELHGG